MSETGKTRTRRAEKRRVSRSGAQAESRVPAGLARTSVYRRVPAAIRSRLDKAILLHPDERATLEAVAAEFKLAERYRITPTALQTYARKLEQLIRPVLTSQLIAAALGCLPESYRQQLVDGSQVLLLSRIVQGLTTGDESGLPVADLAKLASILSAVAGRTTTARARTRGAGGKPTSASKDADAPVSAADPAKMAEAVRMLYGLSWPPAAESSQNKAEK